MEELFYLRQLFSVGTTDWLKVAMLLGFLAVLIYRPERVQRPVALKCACWLFALSIVIPPVLNALVGLGVGGGVSGSWPRYGRSIESPELITLVTAVGPTLFGISVLLGLLALVPSRTEGPTGPVKHPLD